MCVCVCVCVCVCWSVDTAMNGLVFICGVASMRVDFPSRHGVCLSCLIVPRLVPSIMDPTVQALSPVCLCCRAAMTPLPRLPLCCIANQRFSNTAHLSIHPSPYLPSSPPFAEVVTFAAFASTTLLPHRHICRRVAFPPTPRLHLQCLTRFSLPFSL